MANSHLSYEEAGALAGVTGYQVTCKLGKLRSWKRGDAPWHGLTVQEMVKLRDRAEVNKKMRART